MITYGQKTLLKVEEVALLVGCSVKTINNWYWFKAKHPDNEYAIMLPDYIQLFKRGCRYWDKEDMWKIIEFKQNIPRGRNGILGDITQKYYHKKESQNGQN